MRMVFNMSQLPLASDYDEMTEALIATQSPFLASEAHGLLCGVICVMPDSMQRRWEQLVLGPEKDAHSIDVIQQVYISSYQQICEFSFEFILVLPSDNLDINLRTEALGLWCQGFLTGLNQGQSPIEQTPNEEIQEALNDLAEIAQVTFGDIPSTSEDETAYFELEEYVRLVVLMIYHELKTTDLNDLTRLKEENPYDQND